MAPSPPPSPEISAEQIQAIAAGRLEAKRVMRAAGVATFSGWTMVFFASVTLLSGIFSLRALLLGVGLSIIAYVELRGGKRLRTFDLTAPLHLAMNQVGLAIIVSLYAVWGIASTLTAPGPYDEYIAGGGQMADMLEPIDRLQTFVTIGVYTALIGGSVVAQGCTAVYYFTRRGHIVAFTRRTPDSIVETLRVAA